MEIIILLVVAVIGAYFFITTSMKKAEKADSGDHVPSELGKPADEHVEATAPVAPNQTRIRDITDLYRTVLGRDPDEEGLKYWVETQATIEEIKVSMMQSEEYLGKNSQTRIRDITDLYRTVLGRDPDDEGLKYWVETKATIEEIKVSMMQSEEYIAKITPAEEPKPAKRSRSKKK